MRPLSGIFNISGVCILSTHVRMWRMLIRHRRTRVSESKQTTICENKGRRTLSLPDLLMDIQIAIYFPIGSFDGTPAFLGYFFAVFAILSITTRLRSASAPVSSKRITSAMLPPRLSIAFVPCSSSSSILPDLYGTNADRKSVV